MGLLKKLGVPNADKLEQQVKSQLSPKQGLKANPLSAAAGLGRLAKAKGKLGSIEVPGELSVLVQPGKVRIAFEETGPSGRILTDGSSFVSPDFPGFEVAPAGGGEALPVHWYGPIEIPVKTGGVPRKVKSLLGEVEIPATGEYVFRAPQPPPDLETPSGTLERQGNLLFDAA
jgi:hypothetical protein